MSVTNVLILVLMLDMRTESERERECERVSGRVRKCERVTSEHRHENKSCSSCRQGVNERVKECESERVWSERV